MTPSEAIDRANILALDVSQGIPGVEVGIVLRWPDGGRYIRATSGMYPSASGLFRWTAEQIDRAQAQEARLSN